MSLILLRRQQQRPRNPPIRRTPPSQMAYRDASKDSRWQFWRERERAKRARVQDRRPSGCMHLNDGKLSVPATPFFLPPLSPSFSNRHAPSDQLTQLGWSHRARTAHTMGSCHQRRKGCPVLRACMNSFDLLHLVIFPDSGHCAVLQNADVQRLESDELGLIASLKAG